ncbi:hypothetical protein [Arenimonas sp.]|uniref:hypothetical protein n=1 Tax=Arenimonas sp. TaxID=1872635 RepID=UPI0025C1AD45|nr:hypothetical protein [Arenimonas sp.]
MAADFSEHLKPAASDPVDANAPPPALLPYQQRWIADKSQLKIAEKGRRVGLTWAQAADDALEAATAGGSSTFYISANQDMAREYIEAVAMWAKAFDLAAGQIGEGVWDDGEGRNIKTFEVTFPQTGRRCTALTSRPSNLRGKQGRIVIDEAAFHQDLGAMLKAALAMLLWGDRVMIISTHEGTENAFNELIQEVRAGKRGAGATVHRIPFRLAVGEGLYRRVCLRKRRAWSPESEAAWVAEAYKFYGDDAAEELDAIPSQSGGAYLSLALIEQRMVATTPIVRGKWDDDFGRLPDEIRRLAVAGWLAEEVRPHLAALATDQVHVIGEDFGRVADLTVITVLGQDRDLTNRVKLVVELRNCPFRQQEQILFAICDALPRFRGGAMDATGNGAALAEYAANRYGVEVIEQVKLNDAFYLQHMPKLKAGLQDATLTDLPRDQECRDDLRALRVIKGVPKLGAEKQRAAGDDGPKLTRHGDFAIALFLAQYAMSRQVNAIGWTPAPGRDDEDEYSQLDLAIPRKGGI